MEGQPTARPSKVAGHAFRAAGHANGDSWPPAGRIHAQLDLSCVRRQFWRSHRPGRHAPHHVRACRSSLPICKSCEATTGPEVKQNTQKAILIALLGASGCKCLLKHAGLSQGESSDPYRCLCRFDLTPRPASGAFLHPVPQHIALALQSKIPQALIDAHCSSILGVSRSVDGSADQIPMEADQTLPSQPGTA